jgi:N-acetyl-anhydromuramyl-L-alanine amidase AmpD
MLYITADGHVDAEKIKVQIFPNIEGRWMKAVNGIVVHQTASPTMQSAFNSYAKPKVDGKQNNGAHFMIDKDGKIYQNASLYKQTWHVGLLKSRCVLETRCTPTELKAIGAIKGYQAMSKHEGAKKFPDRFPSNADAIGIEVVGNAVGEKSKEVFEPLTNAQQESLKWLVKQLTETLGVSMSEIYRHPELAWKNLTEAQTAQW